MASGTASLQDTRGEGNLLGKIGSAIANRTKAAAQMARKERAFAEEQAEKGDTSLDEAGIEKGYFFKRALGSTFGGDKIARTRGYFEKNPPAGRDPTGTRESRFRGQFDYGVQVTPLEPIIPPPKPLSPFELEQTRKKLTAENMLAKPSTVATEDSEATPVIDKSLNKQVAAALGGIELQLTRLSGKLEGDKNNTNAVAGLVSKNSQILVKGFDSMVAAMSAFKDTIQGQTKSKENIAKEEEQTAEKLADRQSAEAEQLEQEQIDGEAGNADVLGGEGNKKKKDGKGGGLPNFLGLRGFGKFGRGLKFLANPKVLAVLAAVAAGAGLSAFLGKFIGGPRLKAEAEREKLNREAGGDPGFRIKDAGGSGSFNDTNRMYTNPTAIPGDYDYRVPGAFTGGTTTKETLLRVSEGNSRERVTPMTMDSYEMQAEAQYAVMKKRRRDYAMIQSRGLEEYFDRRNGWGKFLETLKGFFDTFDVRDMFNGGGADPLVPRDFTPVGGATGEQNLAAFLSTMEASGNQNQADAFQVMLNRTADAKAGGSMRVYGDTLAEQITAREQFSPLSSAIYGVSEDSDAAAKYGPISEALGSNPEERRAKLLEIASQPDGIVKLQQLFGGGSATDAVKVLQDFKSGGALSKQSATDIGSMVSFRGYDPEGGYDFRRGAGGNYFFGQGSKGKVGSLSQVSPAAAPTDGYAEYNVDGNTPHTIVRQGNKLYRVNANGAIAGDEVPPETAKLITNKETGELIPSYRLQYKPGKPETIENLLNKNSVLPYMRQEELQSSITPGGNDSRVSPLSTEVAMNMDKSKTQPMIVSLPMVDNESDAVTSNQESVDHSPVALVPDWLHVG